MDKFPLFVVRAILGAFFAVVLSRFFRPDAPIPFVMALGIFLVGMAYLSEWWRNRKKRGKRE